MSEVKVFSNGQVVETPNGLGIVGGGTQSCGELWISVTEPNGKGVGLNFYPARVLKHDDQSRYAGYNMDGTMSPSASFEKTECDGRRLVVVCAWAPGV